MESAQIPLGKTVAYASLVLLCIPIFKLLTILIRPYFSPLRELRGPPGGSWITGHINDMLKSEKDRAECHLLWEKEYGHVYVYKSLLNGDRLTTTDPKALNHILANPMIYYKPAHLRLTVGQLIGEGLIFAEGAAHKRQRRVMNPSFSPGHIKEMNELFLMKALELRDALSAHLGANPSETVNIIPFIARCTLDIIGLAGFNTDFNTVKNTNGEKKDENPGNIAKQENAGSTSDLADAFAKSFRTDQGYAIMQILLAWIPPLRSVLFLFDSTTRAAEDAQATMRRIGKQLVEERKRELGFLPPKADEQQSQQRDAPSSGTGKDLLSLMIKANMSPDVSPEQRMTDAEVMHQIPTFMVAGHETTATGLVWALYSLSTHPEVQSRLRTELYTLSSPTPTMNELNELSYFDAVVKECLRLNSPFENTLRIAQADDVIPVGKPFLDRSGQLRDRIRIKKGDGVFLPVLVMNRLEEIWGPDAAEFDPERWFKLPEATNSVPSVWGNQFSFLSGPRSCIGFRFAVMEMKSILYTLIRNFEFKLGVAEEDILKTSA
ncbi:hypothetical protein FRC14_007141 [Serendipita sp. 396]|nr:hypothetical protein FRC14_007141 [Serendipita sp. 396]KAG8777790.1 hypothetical protein FRC15_011117 [Serendipita sp. 397]KAG8795476.1 hypothetical protein FRC16_010061 [Serendipita sp. 398]KAG9052515.1 hypothetical protein FS842_009737 [Serendipita sp. 407]